MFKLEHITKQFSDQYVLQGFSFEILPGEKIIVSGRSGIGKTTLFRLLLGFEQADNGKIYFEDQLLTETNIWDIRRRVAYVSQDLQIGRGNLQTFFNDSLSLKANISHKTDSLSRLKELMAYFELPETLLLKNIEDLSGGEKQRVAIINALLLKRAIFFLDEITSALDKSLKIKVLDYFLLHPDFTVLLISHDNYVPDNAQTRTLKLD